MIPSMVLTFREFLEATLVIVVILSYLKRTGQAQYARNVWYGAGIGVMCSVALALLFGFAFGGLSGATEEIFEGAMMLAAVALLTWMIIWMMAQRSIAQELERKVSRELDKRQAFGIMLLVGVAVLREGVETVIFLYAASFAGGADLTGAVMGGLFAVILGYLIFTGAKKVRLKTFFQITSVILILFAAGLTSHALLEFQKAGILSPIIEQLYDVSWIVDKKSTVGGILYSLFGYTGKPSLTEMIGYLGYLFMTVFLYKNMGRKVLTEAGR
ncbi:MAG: FTR1 family protein [Deltaproteobacteria bacterium]|nr:FTR1 family protein [Deltaproteobacteria bacterium]